MGTQWGPSAHTATPPHFRCMSIVAKRLPISATAGLLFLIAWGGNPTSGLFASRNCAVVSTDWRRYWLQGWKRKAAAEDRGRTGERTTGKCRQGKGTPTKFPTSIIWITVLLQCCTGIIRHDIHFAWVVDDAKCIVVTQVCVSVCLSAAACPHYCTDPDVTWMSGRGCLLVVHYWADLQSVYGLCCYGNITRMRNVSEYMLVLALCLVMFVVTVIMINSLSIAFLFSWVVRFLLFYNCYHGLWWIKMNIYTVIHN